MLVCDLWQLLLVHSSRYKLHLSTICISQFVRIVDFVIHLVALLVALGVVLWRFYRIIKVNGHLSFFDWGNRLEEIIGPGLFLFLMLKRLHVWAVSSMCHWICLQTVLSQLWPILSSRGKSKYPQASWDLSLSFWYSIRILTVETLPYWDCRVWISFWWLNLSRLRRWASANESARQRVQEVSVSGQIRLRFH